MTSLFLPALARLGSVLGALTGGVLLLLGVLPASAASPGTDETEPADGVGGVVVVGVAGLGWSDVDLEATPTLGRLLDEHAAASMTVRTVRSITCAADGWLTLGAGRRAADLPFAEGSGRSGCRDLPVPEAISPPSGDTTADDDAGAEVGAARISGWSALQAYQSGSGYSTELGFAGRRLAEADRCATAVGPGAALALADADGVVDRYLGSASQLDRAVVAECPVTIVDLGGLPGSAPDDASEAEVAVAEQERADAVVAVDEQLAALWERLPEDTALMVAGVADSRPNTVQSTDDAPQTAQIGPSGLRVALAAGPTAQGADAYGAAWLTSASTRWTGLVQLTDIASTLLGYAGVPDPNAGTAGQPWSSGSAHPAGAGATLDQLIGTDRATQVFRTQSGPFFQILGVGQLVFFGTLWLLLHRGNRDRHRLLRVAQVGALAAAAFPVASFLANLARWWRFDRADVLLWVIITAITAAVTALALLGPWRRQVYGPPGVVAALTATVLAVDVWTGSNLQHASLLGLSPLVAGRFYGLGNIPYAIFVAAVLVAAAAAAQWARDRGRTRRLTTGVVAMIGLVAIVTIGSPRAGADVGGILATVPALAVLGLVVAGLRVTLVRIGVAGLIGLVAFTAVAWLDWLRPAGSRTHFGQFFADVLDGQAWTVITRKAGASLGTLQRSPYYGWLVPVAYVAIIAITRSGRHAGFTTLERAWPLVRPLVTAMLLAGAIGFAANDSGIIVPALLLTAGIPLLVSALADARSRVEPEPAAAAPDEPPALAPRAGTAGPGAPGTASPTR